MKVKETALPSVPGPRTAREAVGREATDRPRGPRGAPPGHRRRPRVWVRRLELLNKAVCLIAATVFAGACLAYRDAHPHGLELGRGIDELAWLAGSGVVLLGTLGNLLVKAHLGTSWRLWASSLWFASLCLAGTAGIWTMVHLDVGTAAVPGTQVRAAQDVGTYLHQVMGPRAALTPRIPTGAFVQSIDFTEANNVKVTGYLWQRYNDDLPASLKRGVALPEAESAYATQEVYRVKSEGTETVGWYFQATLRQNFNYDHYPLDLQSVWLRMWPTEMVEQAVLVPDFSAYPPWRSDGRYGVDPGFVGEGWRTTYTTFSYVAHDYSSSMGVGDFRTAAQRAPELHFNVGIARDFVSPLIARLLPVVINALLIFVSLFVITVGSKASGGFSVTGVVASAVSMLLVITVQHTSLRGATGDHSGFVYFEYFYLATYMVILLVALNAVLAPSRFADKVFDWRGNLLPKLLYWPFFLGLIFAATLWSFSS